MASRSLLSLTILLAALAVASALVAADDRTAAPSTEDASATQDPTREVSPLVQEMLERVESEDEQLRVLYDRYRAATSEGEALAIQNEIAALKRSTELDLLHIQLRYALRAGREEQAAELEQAIEMLREQDPSGDERSRATVSDR